ncbi:MAG: ABC transporter ATP-binding protein [Clostridium sp.]|nr:ABC transporter ATP-binding protein [Clostridium sp.]MCM1443983.1 ABC transporter ATP-binding protein [Candidatus Amulumruptor caecigallinarius]
MKVLEVNNLTKVIKKKIILNNLSFCINEGEIVGIVGPNGAGKSTLIKTMLGLYSITLGDIKICGKSIRYEHNEAIKNIGCIIENPDMYMDLSGSKNLKIYSLIKNVDDKEYKDELVKKLKLKNRIDDKIKTYSLGMRQRLGIIQALINKPKILILDEPTNGLDPIGIRELRELILELKESGMTIIISSHILSEIEKICDKFIMLNDGNLLCEITKNELENENISLEDKFISMLENSKGQIR